MNQYGLALLGLTAFVAMLVGVLTFALLRFVSAAQNANQSFRGSGPETVLPPAPLQDRVARPKSRGQARGRPVWLPSAATERGVAGTWATLSRGASDRAGESLGVRSSRCNGASARGPLRGPSGGRRQGDRLGHRPLGDDRPRGWRRGGPRLSRCAGAGGGSSRVSQPPREIAFVAPVRTGHSSPTRSVDPTSNMAAPRSVWVRPCD